MVTRTQALRIGAVGMAARASGLVRDIRQTHPRGAYGKLIAHDPVAENSGDVYARLRVRMREVAQSAGYVRTLLDTLDCGMRVASLPDYRMALESDALAFSLVEGWRGEVCHVGITGSDGQFRQYKIYVVAQLDGAGTFGTRCRHFRLSDLQQKFQSFLLRP